MALVSHPLPLSTAILYSAPERGLRPPRLSVPQPEERSDSLVQTSSYTQRTNGKQDKAGGEMPTDVDSEIRALQVVIEALEPLDDAARSRVIEYALKRLGMRDLSTSAAAASSASPTPSEEPGVADPGSAWVTDIQDIRSLREAKQPNSAVEMATLVAYYLAEAAPAGERRAAVTATDIEKYFKQASYRLPARLDMALPSAASAGYLDRIGRGEFKLNPVAYTLVTQTLPRAAGESTPRSPTRKRTTRKAPADSPKK